MWEYIKARAIECAKYIIDNKCTVRSAASALHISKSTVHKDVTERLSEIDASLHKQVKRVLDVNLKERHLRGGLATKQKYKAQASSK